MSQSASLKVPGKQWACRSFQDVLPDLYAVILIWHFLPTWKMYTSPA